MKISKAYLWSPPVNKQVCTPTPHVSAYAQNEKVKNHILFVLIYTKNHGIVVSVVWPLFHKNVSQNINGKFSQLNV